MTSPATPGSVAPATAPAPASEPVTTPGDPAAESANRRRGPNRNPAEVVKLRLDVFAMKQGGASYRAIGRALDIPISYAHQIVEEELAKLTDQLSHSTEHYRALELERVDTMLARLDGMLREGRKVEKTADGKETIVVMKRPAVGYFFAYFRALARRADLLGLDAPKRIDLGVAGKERGLGDVQLDEHINTLMREIADAERRKQATLEAQSEGSS